MQFVFDTSVLIDYLQGDEMAADALSAAADRGRVFVSLVSLMELWLPLTTATTSGQLEAARQAIERYLRS